MKRRRLLFVSVAVLALAAAWAGAAERPAVHPTPAAPAAVAASAGSPVIPWAESLVIQAEGPYPIDMRNLPVVEAPPLDWGELVAPPPMSRLSEAEIARLREEAKRLPVDPDIQIPDLGPSPLAPGIGLTFESIDFVTAFSHFTPPDPEMAAGPNHLITIVNSAFEVYDKTGVSLLGPIDLIFSFFGVPGCSPSGGNGFNFDPNVLYDEQADRFIIGIDGGGVAYCVAVSNTGDPVFGGWTGYRLPANIGGAFFDYPHAGVGWEAIYMGSNQFGGVPGFEGRVWAMRKADMYAGLPLVSVTQSTGIYGTPWPAHFHGVSDGSFPTAGPHWVLTELYDGCNHAVWEWTDPFGADVFVKNPDLDLCVSTGVGPGFPTPGPQLGGGDIYDIMDWRGQDAEYRNGSLWMTNQGFTCNPGSGLVDCVRWARIDPVANVILDSGVFASHQEWLGYPNLAADACDNMAIGYTATSPQIFPEVRVTGRLATDPPGTLQPEALLRAGDETFDCFDLPAPYRWGDYTGMTVDPDGLRFWYLGQYSKTMAGMPSCDWGTYIAELSFGCSPVVTFDCDDILTLRNDILATLPGEFVFPSYRIIMGYVAMAAYRNCLMGDYRDVVTLLDRIVGWTGPPDPPANWMNNCGLSGSACETIHNTALAMRDYFQTLLP